MDNIIVSMNDNVLVPQDPANFVSPEQPVLVQENVVQGYSDPCTVEIGQTITGEPYTNALVTNSGTSTHAIFDFSLPRGEQGEQGLQGVAGVDGISPIAYVTQTASGATIVIEDSQNTTTANITNGTDGQDGFSPIATVTPTASGATISITDAQGTTTANITNGVDGTDGTDGSDGFSPIATVTQTASGATISITDAQGTTTASITNGVDGTDGTDGSDGFSPIATVTQNTGSATISITDANGTTTATVHDGHDGQGFVNYSTSEVNTGIKWHNNKTIYRKVFVQPVSSIPTSQNWNHGISGLSEVVSFKATFNLGWNTSDWGTETWIANAGIKFRCSTTQIEMEAKSALSWTGTFTFILEYTK